MTAPTSNLTSTGEIVVRAHDLSVRRGERAILTGVNLTIHRGETVAILGTSGAGKSTLLRCLIGALSPHSGKVELFHQNIYRIDEEQLNTLRRRFGVLFQSGAILSSMTVGENIALPLREHTDLDPEMISLVVKLKLELVGLRDFESLNPSQLSGGMRKRVGLARALALDPEILFYDDPSSGLDPITAGLIDQLTLDLTRKMGVTCVLVTHSMESAFRVADRMVILYEGRVRADGTPDEFRESDDPFVRQFVDGSPEGPIPVRWSKLEYETDLLA